VWCPSEASDVAVRGERSGEKVEVETAAAEGKLEAFMVEVVGEVVVVGLGSPWEMAGSDVCVG
jgi:hypothetical protein